MFDNLSNDGFYVSKESKKIELQRQALRERSSRLLDTPQDLTAEEKSAWEYLANMLRDAERILLVADLELVYQFVQCKVMRDRAWVEWNKNPDKYTLFVTGLCADGETPKVVIKENEYYAILNESNKRIEKILDILKLSYTSRRK